MVIVYNFVFLSLHWFFLYYKCYETRAPPRRCPAGPCNTDVLCVPKRGGLRLVMERHSISGAKFYNSLKQRNFGKRRNICTPNFGSRKIKIAWPNNSSVHLIYQRQQNSLYLSGGRFRENNFLRPLIGSKPQNRAPFVVKGILLLWYKMATIALNFYQNFEFITYFRNLFLKKMEHYSKSR